MQTLRYSILLTVFLLFSCSRFSSEDRQFIGKWWHPNGQLYIEVLADKTIKASLPVILSQEKKKSESGISYSEGAWAVYGDAVYSFNPNIDGAKYTADKASVTIKPISTNVKLIEKLPDGNVYLHELEGVASINAKAKVRDDVLEVIISVNPDIDSASSAKSKPVEIVLIKGIMRNKELCLSEVQLTGIIEQCYKKKDGK
ncbi:MAG: hypothetical protein WA081_21245 [Desulfosalsimonadaceae bacterium]